MLSEHRVLTTTQITQLAFPSRHVAHARLLKLHRWRVVDRFQPLVARGSAPHHYVLDTAGAAIIADEDGISPHELGYRHDRAMAIAHSLQLAHTVATNGFFASLVAVLRLS
ncbi:replication-relaxation family protein [Haloechinothrix salitolerans]|uniref:Replication-relaxation family protein n=1 Tax=Haloechinothrix salitolerans TaxID=926830 RepID=A0ABW2C486_9PSEU